jgi:FAD synthase
MHPERVVIARVSTVIVSAVVAIIVATVVTAATIGAFGSLHLGHFSQ